jgi:flavin reductase (DIM6/NTAB) family NADH-FMN oxidoreductase RutF
MQSRIDAEALRIVMRHVPSPVTIVTVGAETEKRGITIGSFTSTSLQPPLVSFNVSREASVYQALITSESFAVHVLSDHQAHLSDHFATPELTGDEQFQNVAYELQANGTPILSEALVVMLCARHAVYDAGDHSIIVGRVIGLGDVDDDGLPLVYFDRAYRRVGREAQPTRFDPIEEAT